MKTVLFVFLCEFFTYCNGMFLLPGKMQHPYWPKEVYQLYAQNCFANISDMREEYKKEIKNYLIKKEKQWGEVLDKESESEIKNALEFFSINWDNEELFISFPITENGHKNTVTLQMFFKKFAVATGHLYFESNRLILANAKDPQNTDPNQDSEIFKKLYSSVLDIEISKLKEAQKLLVTILKYFDTP